MERKWKGHGKEIGRKLVRKCNEVNRSLGLEQEWLLSYCPAQSTYQRPAVAGRARIFDFEGIRSKRDGGGNGTQPTQGLDVQGYQQLPGFGTISCGSPGEKKNRMALRGIPTYSLTSIEVPQQAAQLLGLHWKSNLAEHGIKLSDGHVPGT